MISRSAKGFLTNSGDLVFFDLLRYMYDRVGTFSYADNRAGFAVIVYFVFQTVRSVQGFITSQEVRVKDSSNAIMYVINNIARFILSLFFVKT